MGGPARRASHEDIDFEIVLGFFFKEISLSAPLFSHHRSACSLIVRRSSSRFNQHPGRLNSPQMQSIQLIGTDK